MMWVKVHDVDLEVVQLEPQCEAQTAPRKTPTLVFLHEGLGSVAMWHARQPWWTQMLCDRLAMPGLVYSRTGYGRSTPIRDVRGVNRHGPDYMHRHAWETLPNLLHQMGIERPVLVGHSDGGTIALLYAARHAVTACVVMAPHVKVEPICVESIEQAKQAYEHGELRQKLSRFHDDVDSAFWQWCDVWLSEPFSHLDIRAECQSIQAPVLALQGRQDAYGTLAQIEDIHPRGPIQRSVIESCGHSPHRDQPQVVLDQICSFIQAVM
ncbi:MAG: hypothetical protein RL307_783 [Pseudomonadota bacterium]